MTSLPEFRFPLPLVMDYISHPDDKKDEKKTQLMRMSKRLRDKALDLPTPPALKAKSNKSKDEVLSSTIETGLDEDLTLSYVVSEPGSNIAAIQQKAKEILIGNKADKIVDQLACGDEKNEIKPKLGKKAMKKLKKLEREKTKGPGWFNMKAPEMTDEMQRDLEVLKVRGALDSQRFYKKNDTSALPKYFQIGQVVDSPADYFSDRIPKSQRKKTLVDELMADAEFKKQNKRKYAEIIEKQSKFNRRPHSRGKRKKTNK